MPGRRGHHVVCLAVVACALGLAVTPRPKTAASRAVVKPQNPATLNIVQVWLHDFCPFFNEVIKTCVYSFMPTDSRNDV